MRRATISVLCLVAVAVRFWEIGAPFDDRWSWRQSDVAAIARNYFENGFHFARPQIDWAGGEPGWVGSEFPILPFTAALLYKIFGVREWVGRLLTILFFAASLPFLLAIVRNSFGETAATFALIFYAFAPLMLAASRAFMPDAPSLACALGAWYFFARWLKRARLRDWLTASALFASALLLKPTIATIAAPMGVLAWQKFRARVLRQPMLWLFAAASLIPSVIWYWHAHAIAREFYPHHMFGAGGVRIMPPAWYWQILVQTCTQSSTPVLSVLALACVIMSTGKATNTASAFRAWLLAMILFVIVVGYGNRHEWYRLPLVPIAAAFGGTALEAACLRFAVSRPRKRLRQTLLVSVVMALFLTSSAFFLRRYFAPAAQPLVELGRELHARTPPGALIIVADWGDPTALYYAHRKGWHFLERGGIYDGNPLDGAQLIADAEKLRGHGATHIAFYKATSWWLDYYPDFTEYLAHAATLLSASADFRIYKFNPEQ